MEEMVLKQQQMTMGMATALLCLMVGWNGSLATAAGMAPENRVELQQGLTVREAKTLKAAIEDYQFQEQAKAIAALEQLRKNHPTNLEVLHYLGLSYEETKRYPEAQGAYAQWIKYSGNRMDDAARFAWVGMAKAYDKTKHTAMGIKLLRKWLGKHPGDYDATVALGDMMVRSKDYDGTKALFKAMLAKPNLPANYQASAHYYLGFIAWLEGDVNEVQAQGKRVLRVEPEGGFASVIKQLMTTPPPRRLGLNLTAGAEGFFVDNVESKPSYRTATKGNSRTTGVNVTLGLTWNFRHHLAMNYNFGGTFYSKRPDLNLGLHMFGVTWADKGVQLGPRYEYVTMYNKLLYQGIGADVGYGFGKWILIDSARLKVFSHAVKVIDANGNVLRPDLSYLTAWNNSFMVMRQAAWGKSIWMIGANWVVERTRGNASNPKRVNDFGQVGGTVTVMYPNGAFLFSADMNGYVKKYRGIDATILNAKRKDEYIHLGGGVTWTPTGQTHHALVLKTEWNNNNSNYDFPNDAAKAANAAAYSQWKHTIGYSYTW